MKTICPHVRRFMVVWLLLAVSPTFAQSPEAPTQDSYVIKQSKPRFYTGAAFVGYQGRGLSEEFSNIEYRTTATGLAMNYAARFYGLNLNLFRMYAFQDWAFNPKALWLVHWAEAGVNIPLVRQWGGGGFFSRYTLQLFANTALYKKLYVRERNAGGELGTKYLETGFPQVYDFGLEFRRNLLQARLGYLLQLRQNVVTRAEFASAPEDITGPYFEVAVGLGFWSKREESRVLRKKETIVEAAPPEVHAQVQFTEPSGNGKLEGGEPASLKITLENKGKGTAKGLEVRARFLENKNDHVNFPQTMRLDDLAPNATTNLEISLVADRDAQDAEIEIEVEIFGKNMDRISKEVRFALREYDATDEPPRTTMQNPEAVAVVIGIRHYQYAQVPSVEYAERDAAMMREYLIRTLGFKPENILPQNPKELMTAGTLKTLIRRTLPSYIKKGDSEVYFYYAGHGAPDPNSQETFLVPYDCDPNHVNSDNAYRLSDLYTDLSNLEAKHLTIVMDACFSGVGGDGKAILRNISPVKLRIQNPLLIHPNATMFWSSKADEVSNWYPEKRHGMFTYFFLKGLRGKADANNDRRITVGEMKAYLQDANQGVPYFSNREFQRLQTPVVYSSNTERVLTDYGNMAVK